MKYKLKEIGEMISGGTPSTKHTEYYSEDGIGWITPKDLSNYSKKYICHGARYISQTGLDNSSAKLMPPNSVLVSSRAPIGYVAMSGDYLATNQGFKSIIPDKSKVLPEYRYYLMSNSKYKIEQMASGSTFKEVSGKTMANFEVDIPDLGKQKRIISIMNPIVQKMESNSQINDNLVA
ncbi:restriction endonuclease subunit S [Pediococcus acidilactici]|uniref:restriction endonuclease subunit S n=1 Tax=Pediococcus acidilactici TaxID=1254 RepID=UPI001CCFCA7C|nr:restriction endonuclease subunit S [Pediococcus acidilactici]